MSEDKSEFNFGDEEAEQPEDESFEGGFLDDEEVREAMEESVSPKKRSLVRPLLMVFLLVALGGAGAFYFMSGEEQPAAPAKVAVKKKPIPVPSKSAKEVEEVAKQEPSSQVEKMQPVAAAKPQEVVEEVVSEAPVAVKKVQPEAPVAKAVQKPAKEVAAVASKPEPKAASAHYAVQVGAYLMKANLEEASSKLRALGLEPHVSTVSKEVKMTRLRVGVYPAQEAKAKLASLKEVAPDAFYLRQGDKLVVYAASYFNLNRARSFADRLFEQGVHVDEEPVTVSSKLSMLSYGRFDSRSVAGVELQNVRKAGFEAEVVRVP